MGIYFLSQNHNLRINFLNLISIHILKDILKQKMMIDLYDFKVIVINFTSNFEISVKKIAKFRISKIRN